MQLNFHLRLISLIALCVFATSSAHSQRRSILITELVSVPISLATTAKPSPSQVRETIIAAAIAAQWDIEPQPNGALRASAVRDFDTRLTVDIYYTEADYSLRYVGSENLNYYARGEHRTEHVPLSEYMADWRSSRSAKQPEFKYSVDKAVPLIHPSYEGYLYELSASIRRHLRWALR